MNKIYKNFQDIDSDSGISSVRRPRDKVATSISSTNITTDDEESRRDSNASSITNFTITKTSSEFQLSSTSSRSSGINMSDPSLSMLAISSKQSLIQPLINKDNIDGKSKHGVRNFFKKIFRSSSHNQGTTLTSVEPLNIHRTAYRSMSPLPITQGPIRLFVIRHGERLDRYYSPQWLQQAFDKDGNFCRFSPILP
jgi:hypothetical protein